MIQNREGSTELTRQELYEQVWTTPTVHLAKKYGISDVMIAKICRRHRIPKPPPGYWARVRNGQKVSRKALPAVNNPGLDVIDMRRKDPAATQNRETTELDRIAAFERQDSNRIVVPEQLADPHRLVEKTERSIGSAKADEKGLVKPKARGCLDLAVTKGSIGRAMRILDTVLKALEARGYATGIVEEEDISKTAVTVLDERLGFRLEEEVESKERPMTREQKERFKKYGYYDRKIDYFPTGRLRIRISDGGYPGERKSWGDTNTRPLEDCLNKFIIGLAHAAEGSKRMRAEWEQREREWVERERRRYEEYEARAREEERVKELDSALAAWTRSERIRNFARAIETAAESRQGPIVPDSDLSLWLSWARKRADSIDPLLNWSPVFKQ